MSENLIGRTIVNIRPITDDERDAMGWYGSTEILVLDDGTELIPVKDDEGNNGGVFWHTPPNDLLA